LGRVLVFRERSRRYRFKGATEVKPIDCVVIVWGAAFYTEDQVFLFPQINTFRDRRRAARINRKLQERPQTRERENIYVPVQVPAVDCDQDISGRAGESIKVISKSRIAQVSRCDRAYHLICANW
jgi:hypothetical protein